MTTAACPDPRLAEAPGASPARGLAPTLIGLLGDVHGDLAGFDVAVGAAVAAGVQQLLQVGDLAQFGDPGPREYLAAVDRILARHRIRCRFIDGNHEHLPTLDNLPATDEPGIRRAGRWLDFAGRGARWEWGDTRFLALGGAATFNTDRRTDGVDWWPERELINPCDAERAIAGGPADVLVSHDAPAGTALPRERPFERARPTREALGSVAMRCGAKLVVHGHWHHRVGSEIASQDHRVRVEGLGRTGQPLDHLLALLELPGLVVSAPALVGRPTAA